MMIFIRLASSVPSIPIACFNSASGITSLMSGSRRTMPFSTSASEAG